LNIFLFGIDKSCIKNVTKKTRSRTAFFIVHSTIDVIRQCFIFRVSKIRIKSTSQEIEKCSFIEDNTFWVILTNLTSNFEVHWFEILIILSSTENPIFWVFIRRHTKWFIDDFISQKIVDFIELREILCNLSPHCSKIICKSFFICEKIVALLTHVLGEIVFKESNFQAVYKKN